MDKYLCERCGKELVFRCAYSRIDHKLICVECDDKEQPKELMKKIADLELKLAESVEIINEWMQLNIEKSTEINQLKQQLAEKEKECAVWERAYEYAIYECDFYKNHTQTTNEETMKRIEQLYEKILKRAKLLMEDK